MTDACYKFGMAITTLLSDKGMTIRELAIRVNVNNITLSQILSGSRTLNCKLAYDLATALNMTLSAVLQIANNLTDTHNSQDAQFLHRASAAKNKRNKLGLTQLRVSELHAQYSDNDTHQLSTTQIRYVERLKHYTNMAYDALRKMEATLAQYEKELTAKETSQTERVE